MPSSTVYTPEVIAAVKAALIAKRLPRPDAVKYVRRHFKLSERQGRTVYSTYIEPAMGSANAATAAEVDGAPREDELPDSPGMRTQFKGDLGEISMTDVSPHTLDELLKASGVDLAVWEVERYITNTWQMGRKDKRVSLKWEKGVSTGFVEDSGGITKAPLWQVKAWLRRKVEASTIAQMLEGFTAKAAKHAPKTFEYERIKRGKADCCYVLNIQDLHLAKLAWDPSTGHGDWDIKIAREAYDASINDLMQKAPVERITEIVMIAGSDMLQMDNDNSMTTAGTYVDSDSRLAKAFDAACEMMTNNIDKLASRFKVKVVVIGGNHDSTVSLFLGKYIEAWFRNHPNVTVDSSPRSRKYHGYGKTLLAFDHGDKTKLKDLPLVVMRENQSTISQYQHIECLTGHLHFEASQDTKGIIVRTAPALCAPDVWHGEKGFVGSIRRSQGLLYERENGLEAIFYSKSLNV